MKVINGKKMSQDEINLEFVKAVHDGEIVKVVQYVEDYGADVNSMDAANYARALIYALRQCDGKGSEGELMVKYLINSGAEVNFKHGDKRTYNDSRPYFIYWVAENPNRVSDDLVEFVLKKGASKVLNYTPTTQSSNYISAKEMIKWRRPELYKKLKSKKIINEITR